MTPFAPPQNLDAEQEILGTILVFYRPELVHIAQAAGLLREDFYRRDHQIVYRAILALHRDGSHVDILTVGRFLLTQRDAEGVTFLEHIGGVARLEFLSAFGVGHGFKERAAIVHEDGRWRRWLYALYDAQEHAHDRDSAAFWAAIESIRADAMPEPLRVIEGGKAA